MSRRFDGSDAPTKTISLSTRNCRRCAPSGAASTSLHAKSCHLNVAHRNCGSVPSRQFYELYLTPRRRMLWVLASKRRRLSPGSVSALCGRSAYEQVTLRRLARLSNAGQSKGRDRKASWKASGTELVTRGPYLKPLLRATPRLVPKSNFAGFLADLIASTGLTASSSSNRRMVRT